MKIKKNVLTTKTWHNFCKTLLLHCMQCIRGIAMTRLSVRLSNACMTK